jgi:hypothetical protein
MVYLIEYYFLKNSELGGTKWKASRDPSTYNELNKTLWGKTNAVCFLPFKNPNLFGKCQCQSAQCNQSCNHTCTPTRSPFQQQSQGVRPEVFNKYRICNKFEQGMLSKFCNLNKRKILRLLGISLYWTCFQFHPIKLKWVNYFWDTDEVIQCTKCSENSM